VDRFEDKQLFLGDSGDARNEILLRDNNIRVVINVAHDLNDPWFGGVTYYKVGLHDGGNNRVEDYVLAALLVLMAKENTLLHCHEGRSRTAAVAIIVAAYDELHDPWKVEDLTNEEAIERGRKRVCSVRPLCNRMNESHESFLLEALEKLIQLTMRQ